jgi:hypothetical protein
VASIVLFNAGFAAPEQLDGADITLMALRPEGFLIGNVRLLPVICIIDYSFSIIVGSNIETLHLCTAREIDWSNWLRFKWTWGWAVWRSGQI